MAVKHCTDHKLFFCHKRFWTKQHIQTMLTDNSEAQKWQQQLNYSLNYIKGKRWKIAIWEARKSSRQLSSLLYIILAVILREDVTID